MEDKKSYKDDQEQTEVSDTPKRAAKILQERMRRRRASIGRLIFYIIALIAVLLFMLWLGRARM